MSEKEPNAADKTFDEAAARKEIEAQIRKEIAAERAKKEKAAAAAAKEADALNDPQRRVKIKLFKDNGKYKDPLFVSLGNYRAAIPRGVEVDVPFYIAEHIRETLEQDQHTAELISVMVAEYENNKQALE